MPTALVNASVLKEDEIEIVESLIEKEKSKKKPVRSKIDEYETLLGKLCSLGSFKRTNFKETIATLFLERLEHRRPFVKKAPLQLDSRLSTMEASHSTKEHFVVGII